MACPQHIRRSTKQQYGLTLTELVVVLTILVMLGGLVTPRLFSATEAAQETAARTSLVELRDATNQLWQDSKHDFDALSGAERHLLLVDLFDPRQNFRVFDRNVPEVTLAWRGPYVQRTGTYAVTGIASADFTTVYGADGDDTVIDPWGRPYVIQDPNPLTPLGLPRDVRIVSAGEDGVFTITEETTSADLLSSDVDVDTGDDIYVSFTLR